MTKENYQLRFLPLFEKDLNAIVDYISQSLQNPRAAHRFLSAVEGVSDGHVVAGGQRDRGGHGQRNALVGGAEHGVDVAGNRVVHDGLANLFGVERAERGDLLAVVEGAGVDEVRALAAGLQREVAELQRVRFQQEFGEAMVKSRDGHNTLLN